MTVEVRLIAVDLGETMRQMRMWLDHNKVVPNAFRQSACPGGLAVHVEFRLPNDATTFALKFAGHVLGEPPVMLGGKAAALPRN
ncbi:MAG TPA: hypothetical protein VG651_20900 [Stellaceae bacterium]|nr:hypothetical protein [Stellaceae bacterium]